MAATSVPCMGASELVWNCVGASELITMETKFAISWVLVPNISIPNFIHLYTSMGASELVWNCVGASELITMETKFAISWVLVPNISIPNFIHLYTSITELWAIMLLHHFVSACLAALYTFVATILFMSAILAQLDRLFLVFQEQEIDFSPVHPLITSCIKAIEGMKATPSPTLQSFSFYSPGKFH